jgi:hypothetical protein
MNVQTLIDHLKGFNPQADVIIGGCSACQSAHDVATLDLAEILDRDTMEYKATGTVALRPTYARRQER